MGLFAVLAEAFAVIAAEHHERVGLLARGRQPRQNPADLRIGEGDFAVVSITARLFEKCLRRIIGRVRIVEMDPGEERGVALPPQPCERRVGDDVAAAFGFEARGA